MKPLASICAPALGALALAVAGCTASPGKSTPPPGEAPPTPSEAPSTAPEAGSDPCGASKLARYVDTAPTTDVLAKIQALVGHDQIRTIRPGTAVTMDFRPDRLNLELAPDGRINRVRCG